MSDTTPALPPAPRPYFLITNLQVAMLQYLERDLKPLGITPAAGRVLNAIARRPEVSGAELARMFGISQQSIKQTMSYLEEKGLIERTPSETDRRFLRVQLTEKGWDVRQKHLASITKMYSDLFGNLTDLEMSMLVGLLKKALESARPVALDYYVDVRKNPPEPPADLLSGPAADRPGSAEDR